MSQFFHASQTHQAMSPIDHVSDSLDRLVNQRVPVPANIQQLRTAIEEETDNILQATA
jgi:ABC-type transporter MlaC component